MATSTRDAVGAPSTRARASTAWAGIVFAVLYLVGMLMAPIGPTDADKVKDDPASLTSLWRDFYSDSGHRMTIIVGVMILSAAAIAAIVFGSALRDRLAEAGAPAAGRLVFAASIMFGAVTLVGAACLAWIPGSKQFGEVALPAGDLAYLGNQLGFAVLLLAGGAAAAFMLVTAGWAGARRAALPGWLGWAGVVVGVIVFFLSGMYLPMALIVLWVLVTSIVMLRRPAPA